MSKTKKTGKKTRRYLRECVTFGVNQAKWAAAEQWCEERDITFQVWTEKNMGFK